MFKRRAVGTDPTGASGNRRDTPCRIRRDAAARASCTHVGQINAYSLGYRNFLYRLTRSADDLPGEPAAYEGKGASSCVTGRIDVWSMGGGS